MQNFEAKQHRRAFMLTAVIFGLASVSIWQRIEILAASGFSFDATPGGSYFTMCAVLLVGMVSALIAWRNSSADTIKSAELAFVDDLTGLANRRQFDAKLAQELSRAKRHNKGIAVLYLDLDRFKEINDCYGHDIGDRAFAIGVSEHHVGRAEITSPRATS